MALECAGWRLIGFKLEGTGKRGVLVGIRYHV